ncbi:odorant receptor 67d-like [Anopheles cruzii]|uniref:odorant receptor 67d-like n=1 Tax=Anopheles cruzii TaxID=68878 RepID=UPI0022EC18A4|nr:odorant receptor 67d-like [Anopheles cruzii]
MKFARSVDLYIFNLNYLRWWANFLGLDIMTPNYKPNIRTYLGMVGTSVFFFGGPYTVWYYWANWIKLMESAAVYGFVIQGVAKIYTVVRYHGFFVIMYGRLEQFHREHGQHRKNNATLLQNIHRIHQLSKLISAQYAIAMIVLSLVPIACYLMNGEAELPTAMLVPFTDPSVPWHFALNMVGQYYLMLAAWAGFSASESVILLFVASLAGYADVLKNTVDEMNGALVQVGHGKDRTEVRRKLLEIARLHQRVLEYEHDLEERYYLNNWVQVFSSVFTLTGALFHCLFSRQFSMYTLAMAGVTQLFELCLLGTILSIKNEEIESSFYDSLWYLMDRSEQRTFLILFHKSQHAIEMTIASMAPLNIVTFVSVSSGRRICA